MKNPLIWNRPLVGRCRRVLHQSSVNHPLKHHEVLLTVELSVLHFAWSGEHRRVRKRQNINVLQHIKTFMCSIIKRGSWKRMSPVGVVWVLTSKELILQTFTSSKSMLPFLQYYQSQEPKINDGFQKQPNVTGPGTFTAEGPTHRYTPYNQIQQANSVQCFVMIFLQKSLHRSIHSDPWRFQGRPKQALGCCTWGCSWGFGYNYE